MRLDSLLLTLVEAIPKEWPVWVSLRQFSNAQDGLLTVESLEETAIARVLVSTKFVIELENSTVVTVVPLECADPIREVIEVIRWRLNLRACDGAKFGLDSLLKGLKSEDGDAIAR